jgi:hypothetical protein
MARLGADVGGGSLHPAQFGYEKTGRINTKKKSQKSEGNLMLTTLFILSVVYYFTAASRPIVSVQRTDGQ